MQEERLAVRPVHEWKSDVRPVIVSKVEEFQMLGYPSVSEEEIWRCMEKKVWRGQPEKRIYEVVQDLFHLDSGTYMSFLAHETYKDTDLMTQIQSLQQEAQDWSL